MNCLNGNYKRLSKSEDNDGEEAETNLDESQRQQATKVNEPSSSAGEHQEFEFRAEGKTRILPIVRGGEKISDTHYFVIPPPVLRVPVCSSDSATNIPSEEVDGDASSAAVERKIEDERELVAKVVETVHGVTEEEARLGLSRTHWNYKEACHYLAIEQLFRLGFTRDQAVKALAAADGSLEKASSLLLANRFASNS